MPYQNVGEKTVYAVEYSLPYGEGKKQEPFYPVLTEKSQKIYEAYKNYATQFEGLTLCGRLADFKYYNMDQALKNALHIRIGEKKNEQDKNICFS